MSKPFREKFERDNEAMDQDDSRNNLIYLALLILVLIECQS